MASNISNVEIAVSISQRLNQMISSGSRDYSAWRSLISEIETSSFEDKDTVSLAYDSFMSTFPLCNWHVEKYAHHKAKLCGAEEAIKIYERGAQVAMYSVGFWADYFTFVTSCFKAPKDVRRLFGRALSFVGRDYFCHVLWDKYMKYEFSQEGWSVLAVSYIQALRFPTKKLQFYYNNFKQFAINLEEEMGSEMTSSCELKNVSVSCTSTETPKDDIWAVVKDMLESSDKILEYKALQKYRTIGEELYQEACRLDKEINCFENKIRRRYFYATSLGDDELNNWHHYLDFVEKQGNLDFAVSVYERCLIPCANYPEFWSRYVEFLESKGGRELALSALHRASQIFLKNIPEIHVFNARFKEQIGDIDGARAALHLHVTETDDSFIERVATIANLERRLGNHAAASAAYKNAIKEATEKQKLHILPKLYSHFAGLTFLITGSVDDTRDLLVDGLHQVPHCKFLLEELIRFAMTHDGSNQVNIIDSIIADSISPKVDEDEALSARDRADISRLFLEFVNLCGTVQDVMKAWNRHVKLFPQFLRMSNSNRSFVSTKVYPIKVTDHQPSDSNVRETAPTLPCSKALPQSQDGESTPRLSIQSKEGIVVKSSDHPREDEARPLDFGDKSSTLPDADGEAFSNSLDLEPELKKQKLQQVSLDHILIRSRENGSHESTLPGENAPHNESRRDESLSNLANSAKMPDPKAPPNEVPTPGNSSSQLHAQSRDQKQLAGQGLTDRTIRINQEQTPSASPQVTSYPQESTNEYKAPQQNQHQHQAQPNPAVDPMSQYQYNHQQLMQQYQQQQQMYMQYPYNQYQPYYMNQQPYLMQSQQQQHMNPYNFQGYQLNPAMYQAQQPMPSYQQGQAYQVGHQIPEPGQQQSNYQGTVNQTQLREGSSVSVQNQHVGTSVEKQGDDKEQLNQPEGQKTPR